MGGLIDQIKQVFDTMNGSVSLSVVDASKEYYQNGGAAPGGGTGTVTSVGLVLPVSLFSVSGSPVSTTGTLTGALAVQAANLVLAGPTTGASAAPTMRSLVAADIPSLPYVTTGSPNTFTKAQTVSPVVNSAATGTVTPDASASNNFEYTVTGALTIANPTNVLAGKVLNFALLQDATGGRVITLGANFILRAGDAFSSAANAVDIMSVYCHTNGKLYASLRNN